MSERTHVTCACSELVPVAEWVDHLNRNDGKRHADRNVAHFDPPEGRPGRKEIEHRTEQAAGILQMRGLQTQPNALMTAFWDLAVRMLLQDHGIATADELVYYFGLAQMTELETVVKTTAANGGARIHLAGSIPPPAGN